jgi:hypothetical protein
MASFTSKTPKPILAPIRSNMFDGPAFAQIGARPGAIPLIEQILEDIPHTSPGQIRLINLTVAAALRPVYWPGSSVGLVNCGQKPGT